MAKFELSINVKYLPEWGVWEGIRELIQNGRDAEVEHNAELTVDWKNGTLRIENEGATLSREALLFGTTSKMGRADLIGKFGEGLKLGALALVRAGRSVKIRSADEVWTPAIARSEKLNAEVLMFDIKSGNEAKQRVRIEIGGVTETEWTEYRSRFLFLADKRYSANDVVSTSAGKLLLHARNAGKVYNKGIFVTYSNKLRYGYDLPDIELDRDRKMVNHMDLTRATANVWTRAVNVRPDLFESYYEMVSDFAMPDDVTESDYWTSDYSLQQKVAERFTKQFGDKALPVTSTESSGDIEHYGMKGIVVTKQIESLLRNTVGTVESVKRKLATETTKIYALHELTSVERKNFQAAKGLLWQGMPTLTDEIAIASRIDIVDFRSPTLEGLHHGDTNRISIARKTLQTVETALEVLVHEFAHDHGSDGSKGHVARIEHTWRHIVIALRLRCL